MAFTIADLFEHAVDLMPERTALICDGRVLTFGELEERANRLAHHLASVGVGAGDHIGYYARNRVEVVETLLAVFKLRAVAINVNYRYVADELRYLFTNADLVAVVAERRYAPAIAAVRAEVPTLRHVVIAADGTNAPFDGVDYDEAIAAASPERDFEPRSADDRYILYTGGTTGYPKGVMWRHEDVWRVLGGGFDWYTNTPVADEWQPARQGAAGGAITWFTIPPLIHAAAQWPMFQGLFAGSAVLLAPQFDAHEVWRLTERHQANILVITGDAMARPLLDALSERTYDVSSVFSIGSGAALFSPTVKRECLERLPGVIVTDSVGASETGFSGISIVDKNALPEGGPRIGRGAETVVLDEHNRPVEPGSGVVGRLARSGHIPLGYYKDPAASATAFIEVDGVRYAVPGDLATVEADGSIHLLGRGNMCINTGGEKVYPEEVESVLKAHPDVFDALVFGLPDERFGQRVAAVVAPRLGTTVDLAALVGHARSHLAGYKVPRSVWVTDVVMRMPSGKPDYRGARAFAESSAPLA